MASDVVDIGVHHTSEYIYSCDNCESTLLRAYVDGMVHCGHCENVLLNIKVIKREE